MTRLNDQRRRWKYIIFSLLTFGIYGIYLEWTMINDMNIACGYKERDDSNKSPHYLMRWLLSIVTISIYTWVWYYKQGNRLKNVGEEYGVKIDEKGSTYVLWRLFGTLLFGVGPAIALYLFICNVNKICHAYNLEMEGGRSRDMNWDPMPPVDNPVGNNPALPHDDGTDTWPRGGGATVHVNATGTLNFISGEYAGAVIEIGAGDEVTLGRNQNMCQLVFSEQDISRVHCVIQYVATSPSEAYYYVTDYSSYGTIMNDSIRLRKEARTKCPIGTKLTLGNGTNSFTLN